MVAQAVDGAGQGELGRPQAGHEVAPPDLAPLLHLLQHRIHPGEAALGPLGQRHLPGEHPVALQQLQGPHRGRLGGRHRRQAQGCHRSPPPGARRGPQPGQGPHRRPPGPGRPSAATGAAPGRAPHRHRPRHQGPQRGERVVGDLAGPHQIPQGGQHRAVGVVAAGGLGRRHQLGPERRPPFAEVAAQRLVESRPGAGRPARAPGPGPGHATAGAPDRRPSRGPTPPPTRSPPP